MKSLVRCISLPFHLSCICLLPWLFLTKLKATEQELRSQIFVTLVFLQSPVIALPYPNWKFPNSELFDVLWKACNLMGPSAAKNYSQTLKTIIFLTRKIYIAAS